MPGKSCDVLVVGAGPAGCATAIHLAEAGFSVSVLDRQEFPRDKPCGEGLMPHGVAALGRLGLLGAVREAGAKPFKGIAYHAGGACAEGDFPDIQGGRNGLALRRIYLDPIFHNAARAYPNITLETGVRVNGFTVDPDGVHVETSGGELHAQVIVGADGLTSTVRARAGLKGEPAKYHRYGARLHVELPEGAKIPERVEVHLGELAEFYVTPVGERVLNVAILCEKELTRTFAGDLEGGLLSLTAGCASLQDTIKGSVVVSKAMLCGPLRQNVTHVVSDRLMLVGDAAGFLDPITGEGMSIALVSAEIAAEVLIAALRDGNLTADRLQPYAVRRAARIEDPLQLTKLVMWWVRRRFLGPYVVKNLARNPETFSGMLGIIAGAAPIRGFGLKNIRKLVFRY